MPTCSESAGWVSWALGAVPRAVSGYADNQRQIQQADALSMLAQASCRLGPIENQVYQLCRDCDAACVEGACMPAEDSFATKTSLQQRWAVLEDCLLLTARDVQAVQLAAPGDERVGPLCRIQGQRVEEVLATGTNAVARLGALRWAVPGEATRVLLEGDDLALAERDETRCRVEYSSAESRGRLHLEGGWAELSARALTEHAAHRAPAEGGARALSLAAPSHWSPDVTPWTSPRLIPAQDMLCSFSSFCEVTGGGVLQLQRADMLEAGGQWQEYASRRELISARHTDIAACPLLSLRTDLLGQGFDRLSDSRENLRPEVNERWLAVSVHRDQLDAVCSHGAGPLHRDRGIYGSGVYLAEEAESAAAVAGGSEVVLLLCRCVLGRYSVVRGPTSDTATEGFDSVVANARALTPGLLPPAEKTAWEASSRVFVVRDAGLVFPQYVLYCTRVPQNR